MSSILMELLVATGLFSLLMGAFVLGSRIGRIHDQDQQHMGVIQGATLGLIGLLIGFCFAGAMTRFVERQDLIVQEANAIGTAWLRADLLDTDDRAAIRDQFKRYAHARIQLVDAASGQQLMAAMDEIDQIESAIWAIAIRGVERRPGATVMVLPPINDVFDLVATRNASARRHLPVFALVLVLTATILGASLLGYGQAGKRRALRLAAMTVVMLLGAILWAVIDLDFPQRGLIQINAQPLHDLLKAMSATS